MSNVGPSTDMSFVATVPFGEENHSSCDCCGRPMHTGAGELLFHELAIADYWYRWMDGHDGRFYVAVCPRGPDGEPVAGNGVAVLSAYQDRENLIYSVVGPADAPWSHFGAYGLVLSRGEALTSNWEPGLFELVDAVAAKEARLAARILNPRAGLN